MSAKDDARANARFADRSRTARPSRVVTAIAGFVPGALLAVAALLIPGALPRFERFECVLPSRPGAATTPAPDPAEAGSIRLVRGAQGDSWSLRGADPARLRAAARRWAGTPTLDPGITERRAAARARWSAGLEPGALPPISEAAECAALLRARAAVARALAGDDSTRVAGAAPATPAEQSAEAEPVIVDEAIERAARDADPIALGGALDAADQSESAWLDALATARPGTEGDAVLQRWRGRESAFGRALDEEASTIEAGLTPLQQTLVISRTPELALERERAAPDPTAALAAAATATASAVPPARPMAEPWAAAALVGGLAGAWLALLLSRLSRPRTARRAPPKPVRVARPEEVTACLHVLSGADERRVAAGAATLAAAFLQRGERVLVMDAGRRLRLHEYLGGDPRWGVSECMAGEMPVLGTVQNLGGTGLYLLARGRTGGTERWSRLGRLLEDARPHFGQIVLALDPAVPQVAGEALRGRLVEGWWAGSGEKLPRIAAALSERIGITLHGLELKGSLETALEALTGLSVQAPAPIESPIATPGEKAEVSLVPPPAAPTILDCDLQVRERLRFLLWMKGIQAEGRRVAAPAQAETGAALEH